MGLKEARDAARTLREQVRHGHDPIAEARQRRAEARRVVEVDEGLVTLIGVVDAYGKAIGASRRSWAAARRQISNVFGRKLTRPVAEITSAELQLVVDAHPSVTSAGAATRYLRPILRWAAKRGLIPAGIAAAIEQPEGAQRVRQRVLSRDEVRAILCTVDGFAGHGQVLRWLFWTGCRLNEACTMRWCDIDDERARWTIPQTKQGGTHTVPLPRQAMDLLRTQCRGADGGLVFTNTVGNRLAHWDRITKRIQAASNTTGWHRHDVRRTAATLLGDMGIAPHVIERVLGHALRVSSDGSLVARIAATYNISPYRTEHADALQRLADELDRIIDGKGADQRVVRLRA
jgi:integrase